MIAYGTSDQVLHEPRCWQNRDDRKERDEGRNGDYDAEERDKASARFWRNPHGHRFCAAMRDLIRGSLVLHEKRI